MSEANPLGDYLRARRASVRPAAAGLPEGRRRRVSGLRREEVAMLAGISPEYYLRLEQGRHRHPSREVLDGLVIALQLDREAAHYLFGLAGRAPSAGAGHPPTEVAGPAVETLIDGFSVAAAYVMGRSLVVIAANRLAQALSPHFGVGRTPIRAAFLEPDMRELYRDWEEVTERVVAYLRSAIGEAAGDEWLIAAADDLSSHSPRFRELWARQEVRREPSGITRLAHPRVGDLDLFYLMWELPGVQQILVTYHAAPGSESERRLRQLHTEE